MKIIIGFLIFCLVLFIYLHVQFHLKKGEDLEMYEIEQPSKDRLEEICDLRQPVLFDFNCQKLMDTSNKDYIIHNYHAFEIKIRNTNEDDKNNELYIPFPLHSAVKLFNEDKTSCYFTENNMDFLEETGVVKNFKYNDEFLRPYMVSNCNYDFITGSINTCTPFRYEINYRNYLLLTQGSAQIKLTQPHSTKYLYPIYDYENFEFKSPVNPWKPQAKYTADFDKIKCLEFTLIPGKTLYIPAYWWYSIKFNDNNTSISCFNYRTYMNNLAILPYICLHALQIQNVKRDVVKKVSIDNLNKENTVVITEDDVAHREHERENQVNHENQVKNDINHVTTHNSNNNVQDNPIIPASYENNNLGTEI